MLGLQDLLQSITFQKTKSSVWGPEEFLPNFKFCPSLMDKMEKIAAKQFNSYLIEMKGRDKRTGLMTGVLIN